MVATQLLDQVERQRVVGHWSQPSRPTTSRRPTTSTSSPLTDWRPRVRRRQDWSALLVETSRNLTAAGSPTERSKGPVSRQNRYSRPVPGSFADIDLLMRGLASTPPSRPEREGGVARFLDRDRVHQPRSARACACRPRNGWAARSPPSVLLQSVRSGDRRSGPPRGPAHDRHRRCRHPVPQPDAAVPHARTTLSSAVAPPASPPTAMSPSSPTAATSTSPPPSG